LKVSLFLPADDGVSAARLSRILAEAKRRTRTPRRVQGKPPT